METIITNITTFCANHSKYVTGMLLKNLDFLVGLFINLVLILFFCWLIDIANSKIFNKLQKKVPEYPMLAVVPITLRASKFIIACLIIATFLQSCGYNVTSIVAGFGIVGLAVGFAAQTTIGNVFGSFSLLIDKVYKIGDYIQYEDRSGYVESINLRSTTLRTIEGFMVNIPNNILANQAITNISQTCKYKIDIKVAIECDTPVEKIKEAVDIMQDIADKEELLENTALAFIESIEDTAINLRLVSYTTSTKWKEYMLLRSEIIAQTVDKFQKANISFDVPDSRISIENLSALKNI